jgi:hypothetical protein
MDPLLTTGLMSSSAEERVCRFVCGLPLDVCKDAMSAKTQAHMRFFNVASKCLRVFGVQGDAIPVRVAAGC